MTSKPLKERPVILIIENAIAITGSVKSILRSCSLLGSEFEFEFVLPAQSKAISFIKEEGFAVSELPMVELSRSWKALILYIPRLIRNWFSLKRIIAEKKAKLLIANDFYNMLPPLYCALGGRVPYITFVRFMPDRFPALLVRTWCFLHYKFSSKVIAVSESVVNKLRSHPKLVMIHNEISSKGRGQPFLYNRSSNIILYLSNYIPGKGLEYGVRAFASLGEDYQGWALRFVGGDMGLEKNRIYKTQLQFLANQLGVFERIQWADFSDNVEDEFKEAAIVLNFSDSESFSLTCAEAMLCGRPVIATRCGGPEEIITSGKDGELVEVRNQQQMNIALKKLLSNPELREKYGAEAAISISTKFSHENTSHKLELVFLEIMKLDK